MARASTRKKASEPPSAGKKGRKSARTKKVAEKPGKNRGTKKKADTEDDIDDEDPSVDQQSSAEDDAYNSDALDEEDDTARTKAKASLKRKRTAQSKTTSTYFDSPSKKAKTNKSKSPSKTKKTQSRKKRKVDEDEEEAEETGASGDEDADDEEFELAEGQEIVGKVVQAPTTGRVPPGQISQNTLDFLKKLKDPKCNDRQWFKIHEPVYRLAEKEWKDFVEAFTDLLVEVDSQIPPLPPKDVIHRIYRDIRFSNDKTPYKTGFSASFSRSGRKGIFAGYHIAVKSGGESIIAAGTWCPGRNELATIRANLLRSSTRLRRILSNPTFVKHFGKPEPRKDGGRQSVFGMEDELKTAPKGVDKNHEDIDLLRLRSFAVIRRFTDEEVLDPQFKEMLAEMVGVVREFVHCLNDMMTIGGGTTGNGGSATGARNAPSGNDEEEDDEEVEEGDEDEDDA